MKEMGKDSQSRDQAEQKGEVGSHFWNTGSGEYRGGRRGWEGGVV